MIGDNALKSLAGLATLGMAAAVLCGFVPTQYAHAQTSSEIRYATSAPPNTVWAMQVERMVKIASESSGGAFKINAFLNSQLGSEQDTIQQVARGRIDMGGYSVAAVALLVPELALATMPFLFKDTTEQDCVYDNHLTKITTELLAKKGVQFLSWSHVGVSHIIGKKPFLKPEELSGMKARSSPTKLAPYMWLGFGANPNPMPVTEWTAAHQSGLVEVADSGMTFYMFSGLNKVAPVVTLTGHIDAGGIVVINKAAYDKLPDTAKKAMVQTTIDAPASLLRKEVREFETKLIGLHKSQGGNIVELSPEQREVWRKGMTTAWPKMVDAIGGDSNQVWKVIQDGIKSCAK
jgi:TRAP-type transport system periplasmic protein